MKKEKTTISILLSILLYIVFLLTCILPFFSKLYLKILNPIFWTVLFIYTFQKYNDVKIRDKWNTYYARHVFYISLIFAIIYFFMGFFAGFKKMDFPHGILDIVKNIYLFGFVICFEEFIRYYLINGSKKTIDVPKLSTFLFIVLDLILYYYLYNYTVLKHIVYGFIPIVLRNIVCLTFARKKTLLSAYLIRLFPIVIYLTTPVAPNVGPLFITIFEIIYFIIIYLLVLKASIDLRDIDKKIRVRKNQILKFTVLNICSLVVLFIIGFFSYVPYAISQNDMSSMVNFGDLIIYKKVDSIENIEENDMIVILKDNRFKVRYIANISKEYEDNVIELRTDNEYDEDTIRIKDVIGVYKYRIKYLGYVTAYLHKLIDKEG